MSNQRLLLATNKGSSGGGGAASTDSNFNYVAALFHGDGSNNTANNTSVATPSLTLTRNGTLTEGTFTPYGSNWSNQFGSGNYLSIASNTVLGLGTGDFTIECWVYNISFTATSSVVAQMIDLRSAAGATATALGINNSGKLTYYDGPANVFTSDATALQLGVWYHVALTRTGGVWRLFKNGTQVATTTSSSDLGSSQPARIGCAIDSTSVYINGYVSNLRVIKGTSNYTSNFTPATAPLTAITGTSLLACKSNTFADVSSNALVLTTTGSPSVQRFNPFGDNKNPYSTSQYGGSCWFDGSSGYLSTPSSTNYQFAGDFTIEAWVYPTSLANTAGIFGYWTVGTATACAFAVRISSADGSIVFNYGVGATNGAFNDTSVKVKLNQWNHIAVTRSGTTVRVFVNGVVGTSPTTISGTFNNTSGNNLLIGYDQVVSSEYTAGYICDARIVNGTALYTASFTPPNSPLSAVTNTKLLYQAQNAAVYDNSMVNNAITVGNTVISTTHSQFGGSSLYFDGSNSGIWLHDSPYLNFYSNNFTIECWIYPTGNTASAGLFGKRNASTEYAQCEVQWNSGSVLTFYATTASGSWPLAISTGAITLNVWSHVAFVRNGNSFLIFVNGTLASSGSLSGALMYNSAPFVIGGTSQTYSAGGAPFAGYIDDFRITNGVARYTANFTVPSAAFPNQ